MQNPTRFNITFPLQLYLPHACTYIAARHIVLAKKVFDGVFIVFIVQVGCDPIRHTIR